VARRKADGYSDRSAFTSLDQVQNCTFMPKVGKGWAESGSSAKIQRGGGDGDDGNEEKTPEEEPMAHFVKRSDAWGRKVRASQAVASGKQAYEALLTRKVCPSCKHPDGALVFQAYDEFLEKRDACAACGKKYVRQSAWGDVKASFWGSADAYAAAKQRNLAELRRLHVTQALDPRLRVKKVYDPHADATRVVPLFATYRDEDQREEVSWGGSA
jgi:hypothetical protein